jgi:predicted SprT family Zn-dependent metalloprotease
MCKKMWKNNRVVFNNGATDLMKSQLLMSDRHINTIKKLLTKLSLQHDVQFVIRKNCEIEASTASCGSIYLNFSVFYNINELFTFVFHELGHVHCYRNKIWKSYHSRDRDNVQAAIATAWKAEKWVEAWGKKKMNEYLSVLKYTGEYSRLRSKKRIMEYKEFYRSNVIDCHYNRK